MEALDLVGLSNHARRFPAQISGGEQQRAAIARAIVRSPQLLIADEPTANLPPDASWEIMQLLGRSTAGGSRWWSPRTTAPWSTAPSAGWWS